MSRIPDPALRETLVATAHALADAARVETLRHFRAAPATDNKDADGFDPVTIADRAAERAMRDHLCVARPDDAILGEEYGTQDGTTGLTWVLDPIDGTRGYIAGTPTWGTLVAVSDAAGPLYGIVDQPYIGERFEGGFGRARMAGPHGPRNLATSATTALDTAILMTTFPEIGTAEEARAFAVLRDRVRLTRYGMDCYAYALLAAGQVDLVVEAGLNPYDVHAPIAVVQAAGGIVTDWTGGPAHPGGRIVAAANAGLHARALDALNGN